MKTEKILTPRQAGTKKWLEKHGDDLICVRYRHDKTTSRKFITIEIIVAQKNWEQNPQRIPHNKLMPIQVSYNETQLRKLVKAAGGRWNPVQKAWELPYGEISNLGLEKRIMKEHQKMAIYRNSKIRDEPI